MSVFWALRKAVHYALGEKCVQCGSIEYLDINHIKNDGTKIRLMWGLSGAPEGWNINGAMAYFFDMLWGIYHKKNEVELLCRKCHEKFHKKYGYEEMV